MLHRFVCSACFVASVCFVGSSPAAPLDTPDLVYIDGVPCNRPCQAYMKWSRDTLAASSSQHVPPPVTRNTTEASHSSHSATMRKHFAKIVTPRLSPSAKLHGPIRSAVTSPNVSTPTKTNGVETAKGPTDNRADTPRAPPSEPIASIPTAPKAEQPDDNTGSSSAAPAEAATSASEPSQTATVEAPGSTSADTSSNRKSELGASTPSAPDAELPDTGNAAPSIAPAERSNPASETSQTAEAPSAEEATTPNAERAEAPVTSKQGEEGNRSTQQQIAAAASTAERLTKATRPATQADTVDQEKQRETKDDKTGSISNTSAPLIALLISRPEINSVSDLAGKNVAIDNGFVSERNVRTALVAAGAPGVELSEGSGMAIDRLVNGEVPAAVVELVSPDAAAAFPDIPGYKVLRVPLSPAASLNR
jgi:hypothetical protein